MTMINIGHGNSVSAEKIVAVVGYESNPSKRLREDAIDNGRFISATDGGKSRCLIVLDGGFVVASINSRDAIRSRLNKGVE